MEVKIYTRRFNSKDTYYDKRTEKGWNVQHLSFAGECDKTGSPYLFNSLEHDCVSYPADLGEYMAYLWDQAEEHDMPEDEIQAQLDAIGLWICATEKAAPRGIAGEYKL